MSQPEPMTPPDCDLRDFAYMPLEVLRLRDSGVASLPSPEAFRACVLAWCVSWHQVPAASLPDDDNALSVLLGYGRATAAWSKVRNAGGLHGWIKCSDGRLYHPVVAEKAREAWQRKQAQKERSRKGNKARWGSDEDGSDNPQRTPNQSQRDNVSVLKGRADSPARTPNESQRDDFTVPQGRAISPSRTPCAVLNRPKGSKEERKEEREPPYAPLAASENVAPAKPSPARRVETRGCRLPDDWQPSPADCAFAVELGLDVAAALAEFSDYWRGVPGSRGRKLDWPATWRNRCRERAARQQPRAASRRETPDEERRRVLKIPNMFSLQYLQCLEQSDAEEVPHGSDARH